MISLQNHAIWGGDGWWGGWPLWDEVNITVLCRLWALLWWYYDAAAGH